jgi:hypothetical protein
MLEVVERPERRCGREMRVQVNASREHELAVGVDLVRRWTDIADPAYALAVGRDIRGTLTLRRDDGPAADG